MQKFVFALALLALLVLGAGQALARPAHAPTKVTIVMKDPGCHWFSVAGKLQSKLTVTGPAKVLNLDEAALKIAGAGVVRHTAIGKTVVLGKGLYTITMVGQKSDDNRLKLIVR
jgi:hypothetical protein